MKKISIVIPVYNESEGLLIFYKALDAELSKHRDYSFEVLFVNDGSVDDSIQYMYQLREAHDEVCVLDLSRNHGKELALAAGFDFVSEDAVAVIIMDADLQHPPHIIAKFIERFEQGFEDIYAIRKDRKDESALKRLFTKIYYQILISSSEIQVYKDVGDFRLLSRKAFNCLQAFKEKERYTKGYYSFIGFKKYAIEFEVPDRIYGSSKWSFFKLMNLAINGITSFSTTPLRISSFLGFGISMISFLYIIFTIFKTIFIGESVTGYPTLLCSILLIGGIQLIVIGILGEYVGKIFNEVKNRPIYFVNEYLKSKSK
jgi:polyisoprenyl-phosphate glycosyltransferase